MTIPINFFMFTLVTIASFIVLLPIRTLNKIRDKFFAYSSKNRSCTPALAPAAVRADNNNTMKGKPPKKWSTLTGAPTKLFAHRGERILFPEHTLPGYEVAAILHADYVEPDLVLTKDGHLVCHHDLFLKNCTDVELHPEFAHLQRSFKGKIGHDSYDVSDDWFIKDFTLEQLKKLRVRQPPIGIRPQVFNALFEIPSYVEFLQLVQSLNKKLGRRIGIVPELKYPTFHNGLDDRPPHFMEDTFLEVMRTHGYASDDPRTSRDVTVQCFEASTLEYLIARSSYETLLLIDTDIRYLTHSGIQEVARLRIGGLSIWKQYLVRGTRAEAETLQYPFNEEEVSRMGGFVPSDKLVAEVHRHGLKLGIYTVKDSSETLEPLALSPFPTPPAFRRQNKIKEMEFYFEAGVDAMFVENVAESVNIRENYNCKLALMRNGSGSGSCNHY